MEENDIYTVKSDVLGTTWSKNGLRHRDGGRPAYRYSRDLPFGGADEWYLDGQLHRDGDKPAKISRNGTKEYFKHSVRHRDSDKPAVVFANGEKWWLKDGKFHRGNDLPAIIFPDDYYRENLYFWRGREYSFRGGEKYFLPLEELSDFSYYLKRLRRME